MIYFTSDNHFYHKNIIKYEDRPFSDVCDMNRQMIKNWNQTVNSNDSIYILGDLAFTNGYNANYLLTQLNGKKFLIKGNHDSFLNDNEFDRTKFEWVRDYYHLKHDGIKFILFHYPIAVWDCKHHGSIHLYGHIHSNKGDNHPLTYDLGKAYNVGVDVNDFKPISIVEIINKLK
jgi:calcineurin-like phosphoesterase family protein